MSTPPRSTWATPSAWRTYAGAVLWVAGGVLVAAAGEVAPEAGWLRIRWDPAGLTLTAAALVAGTNFFPKAVRAIRRRRLDMNFLMTIAIVGAIVIGEPLEAAAIAVLFSVAELLEAAAVARARRSIEALVALVPDRARRVEPDGSERELPVVEVRTGDRLRIRPGEKLPVDGRVVDGASAVDQAAVTGESVPVTRQPGDAVYAGTIVVEGYLEIEATSEAGDTTLDRIVQLVRQAQGRRTRSEQFVERFARVYTPLVTAGAVLVAVLPPLFGWGDGVEWFVRGLTLLVVACPCALVIATPVTVVSAITSAARHGVLVKSGEHLETLGQTCAMAFDKTGTLTRGQLAVTEVEGLDGADAGTVLALAAAVEQRSEHPVARAIVARADADGARREGFAVRDFVARTGKGVRATVDGEEVLVGTPDLLGLAVTPERFGALQRQGRTVVLVARGDGPIGLIALADQPRASAGAVLEALGRLGVRERIMLTGDHQAVAEVVARDVGITTVRAGLLPEDKVAAIEALRAEHAVVAMMGDGVNDAPALAAASVGVVMGAAGSPAAIETADIALMDDDLRMLPYAVRLARRARRTIRFNIGLALGLKGLLALGAVTGTVSLMVAVLVGDLGASLVVTGNAMGVARMQPEDAS